MNVTGIGRSMPVVLLDMDTLVDWDQGFLESWTHYFETSRMADDGCTESFEWEDQFSTKTNNGSVQQTGTASSSDERSYREISGISEKDTIMSNESTATFQVGSGQSLDTSFRQQTSFELDGSEMKTNSPFNAQVEGLHPVRKTWDLNELKKSSDTVERRFFTKNSDKVENVMSSMCTEYSKNEKTENPEREGSQRCDADSESLSASGDSLSDLPPSRCVPPAIHRDRNADILLCIPKNYRSIAEYIIHQPHFYFNLPPKEGALQAIKEMAANSIHVLIYSAPLTSSPFCTQEKLDWIRNHLGPTWLDRVVITCSQSALRADVLIDDKPADSTRDGNGKPLWTHVLFDMPYNRLENIPRIRHWSQWSDIILPLFHKSPVAHSLTWSHAKSLALQASAWTHSSLSPFNDRGNKLDGVPIEASQRFGQTSHNTPTSAQSIACQTHRGEIQCSRIHDEEEKWRAFAACFKKAAESLNRAADLAIASASNLLATHHALASATTQSVPAPVPVQTQTPAPAPAPVPTQAPIHALKQAQSHFGLALPLNDEISCSSENRESTSSTEYSSSEPETFQTDPSCTISCQSCPAKNFCPGLSKPAAGTFSSDIEELAIAHQRGCPLHEILQIKAKTHGADASAGATSQLDVAKSENVIELNPAGIKRSSTVTKFERGPNPYHTTDCSPSDTSVSSKLVRRGRPLPYQKRAADKKKPNDIDFDIIGIAAPPKPMPITTAFSPASNKDDDQESVFSSFGFGSPGAELGL